MLLFNLNFLLRTGVQHINSAVTLSGEWQRDPAIHTLIHVYILLQTPFSVRAATRTIQFWYLTKNTEKNPGNPNSVRSFMIPVSTNVFKSQDAAQRSKRSHWVGLSSSVFTANLWAFLPRITSLVNMLGFFSPPPRSLWDLSSLTRDQTQPQQGKHRILTTRPPGDSLGFSSFSSKYQSETLCQGFKRRWRRGKLKFNLQTGLHYPLCVVWSMSSFFKLKKLNIYSDSEILIHIYEID